MKSISVKLILLPLILICLISCANNSHNKLEVLNKDKAMYKDNSSAMEEKYESIFAIVDHFSSNYPYSAEQTKNFFDADFVVEQTENIVFKEVFLYPSQKNDDIINIKRMEIRSHKQSGNQLFILELNTPLCFGIDNFLYRITLEDYTWVTDLDQFSFAKIMDKSKNIGTVELFFNSIGNGDDQVICVNSFLFDTFEVFDRSKYERIHEEQRNNQYN